MCLVPGSTKPTPSRVCSDNQDKIAALLTENAALTADLPARIVAALDGSVTVEPT